MNILNKLGFRKPAATPVDWEAKFKRAATDLAAQADEIAAYGLTLENSAKVIADDRKSFVELTNEIASLRPDAEAMRAKRKRDRDMKAAKRGDV